MNKESVLEILEQFQEAAMHIAEAEIQIRELNKIIEEQKEMLENFKRDILVWTVEDYDPNSDPEEVPPVTDLEEVQKVTGRGGKPKRIFMRNTETGVEKEFPSKTRAAQFLDITQQYLAKILKDGGTFKGWRITEVADTPGA